MRLKDIFDNLFKDDQPKTVKEYYKDSNNIQAIYTVDEKGVRNGRATWYFEDGKTKAIGAYKDGKMDGMFEEYCPVTGLLVRKGAYKDGKKEGEWEEYSLADHMEYGVKKDAKSEEYFLANYPEYANYLEYVRTYKQGKLDGICRRYYLNGQLQEEYLYENDKLVDGTYKTFFMNGRLQEVADYKNGVKHGQCTEFDPKNDKIKIVCKYVNGQKEGPFQMYEGDALVEEGVYKNGKPVIAGQKVNHYFDDIEEDFFTDIYTVDKKGLWQGVFKSYYDDGALRKEYNYKDGKEDGPYTCWGRNGRVCAEGTYKNGKKEGLQTIYYRNGLVFRKENYKNGKPDGLFEEYDERGCLVKSGNYVDGKFVENTQDIAKVERAAVNKQIGEVVKNMKPSAERAEILKTLAKNFRRKHTQKSAGRAPRKPRGGNEM